MTDADLTGANLWRARYNNSRTTWPRGFTPPPSRKT